MTTDRCYNVFSIAQQILFFLLLLLNLFVVCFVVVSAYQNYCKNNSVITNEIKVAISALMEKEKIDIEATKALLEIEPNIYFDSNTISYFFNIFTICLVVAGGYLLSTNKRIHNEIKNEHETLKVNLKRESEKIEAQAVNYLCFERLTSYIAIINQKILFYHSNGNAVRTGIEKINISAELRESLNSIRNLLFNYYGKDKILSPEQWDTIRYNFSIIDSIFYDLDKKDKDLVDACKKLIKHNKKKSTV